MLVLVKLYKKIMDPIHDIWHIFYINLDGA